MSETRRFKRFGVVYGKHGGPEINWEACGVELLALSFDDAAAQFCARPLVPSGFQWDVAIRDSETGVYTHRRVRKVASYVVEAPPPLPKEDSDGDA